MAGAGPKKRLEENRKRLSTLRLAIAVGVGLYLLVRLILRKGYTSNWHLAGFAFTLLVEAVCYSMIAKFAEPAYGEQGELVYGGADLNMGGMCSYYHDLLYISIFVQAASCLSTYFWYLYLAVPGYGFYLLWKHVLGPYFAAAGQGQEGQPLDEASRKKLERTQQRAERRKMKWR